MSHELVAENSKRLAKKYSEEGKFGRAFSHYLVVLKLKPEWKSQLRDDFLSVLCKWGTTLDEEERFKDLFFCYEQALEILPEDVVILNNIGSHLLRCGSLKEASNYFRKCLKIDPHFLRASLNLENVYNLAVERWHFRMLNDQHRNEAFREALLKKVKSGFDQVLDIGTGTGILSLFCLEAGAKSIYACDSSPIMVEIAERVFRGNGASGINLICRHSTDLRVGEDLPARVSLLATETFDAGLLGEGIVQTLAHAWENLLLPPQRSTLNRFGLVIPLAATVYLTGIECDAISNNFYPESNNYVDGVRSKCDSYDTYDLKRTRFRCLTETAKIFYINFNDPDCIKKFVRGCEWKLTLTCKNSGRLDCFAVWFDLFLDEDIVLKSAPESDSNVAWDQAIFPLNRHECVNPGQKLHIVAKYKDKLSIAFNEEIEIGELPEEAIQFLNDSTIKNESRRLANLLASTFTGAVSVLDLFPFPVFGLDFIGLNKVPKNKLTSELPESYRDLILPIFNRLSREWGFEWSCSLRADFQEKFDVIFANVVEMRGELKDGILSELNYWKSLLNPNGKLIPEKVTVMGQFIYSDFLTKRSKVINDTVTCGYKIAEFINAYEVQHYIDLDFASMEKIVYSDPFELFNVFDSIDTPTVSERTIHSISPLRSANALVYWFRIRLWQDCEFSTNQGSYHQIALLFPDINETEIRFKLIHSNGLFKIEFLRS